MDTTILDIMLSHCSKLFLKENKILFTNEDILKSIYNQSALKLFPRSFDKRLKIAKRKNTDNYVFTIKNVQIKII